MLPNAYLVGYEGIRSPTTWLAYALTEKNGQICGQDLVKLKKVLMFNLSTNQLRHFLPTEFLHPSNGAVRAHSFGLFLSKLADNHSVESRSPIHRRPSGRTRSVKI